MKSACVTRAVTVEVKRFIERERETEVGMEVGFPLSDKYGNYMQTGAESDCFEFVLNMKL